MEEGRFIWLLKKRGYEGTEVYITLTWSDPEHSPLYRYLVCGDLHHGFARVKCRGCHHEYLLTFSCKRPHLCPSCHQKRVVEFGGYITNFNENFRTRLNSGVRSTIRLWKKAIRLQIWYGNLLLLATQ